ncbi:guanine nucleotide-binding protein subunit alpha SCDLUD_003097 [Saccharomycodes ludwigii]|uniref:guanine nucleotide-binding protein subunit alpha n=1 Tax=Saccharomycodes ludwigii TaxID=36035 RepID=UPI001E87A11B|nr:hypothetical protein SCDLUD_003097 [Saccharomycodes ludwigii]KAH3900129.1 hypothetical protein SCDLUD_003097 [Saccharomycodes ludwigii]
MGCILSTSANTTENHDKYYQNNEPTDPFLENKKANDLIEQTLKNNQKKDRKEVKLLLLGAGESGKSTVLKQLKLLHLGGFNHQERLQYVNVIRADAIQSMKMLIIEARKLGIPLDCDDPHGYRELFQCKRLLLKVKPLDLIDTNAAGGSNFLNDYVLKYSERSIKKRRAESTGQKESLSLDTGNGIYDKENEENSDKKYQVILEGMHSNNNNNNEDDDLFVKSSKNQTLFNNLDNHQQQIQIDQIAYSIKQLWKKDKGIQQCFMRSNEFQLEGSANYYFDNIERFSQPDYICTDEDILKGRIKTTGITETNFNINSTNFKVLDAGGQRSERRKWIHCFDKITCVLFVVAVSEYDQMLFEDERVNRMHEALMLFDTLCNSKWFINTPFVLFMNKVDLFQEKIKRSPIRKHFPNYQGRVNDVDAGLKYFEKLFLSLNRTNKPIYIHRTCATDKQSMKFILSAVTDLIIQQNLKKSGLL